MGNNKKAGKHTLFNLFDIVVIVIAVLLAAVLFISKNKGSDPTAVVETHTQRYTVELTGMVNGSEKMIAPGDVLVDKIKKYDIGTVVSVDIEPTTKQVENKQTGDIVNSEVPGQQTAIVVVEANASENDTQITVDGGFVLKVGLQVNIKGPGYYGTGYIIDVERGEG